MKGEENGRGQEKKEGKARKGKKRKRKKVEKDKIRIREPILINLNCIIRLILLCYEDS